MLNLLAKKGISVTINWRRIEPRITFVIKGLVDNGVLKILNDSLRQLRTWIFWIKTISIIIILLAKTRLVFWSIKFFHVRKTIKEIDIP